eukprot:ANDGO_00987.mRNA.1 DNA cross-link repair protein SNM1
MKNKNGLEAGSKVVGERRKMMLVEGWCPDQKRVPGTDWIVDGFSFRVNPTYQTYFLTHYHSDHYGGLGKSFENGVVYCSEATAKLVILCLQVDPKFVKGLPLNTPQEFREGVLTLLDANHCPGSALFLFEMNDGKRYLHTGDFRADPHVVHFPLLKTVKIDILFLDTTYCAPRHVFPPQSTVLSKIVEVVVAERLKHAGKNVLILIGAYSIGKERVAMAIARRLECKIVVAYRRLEMLRCCLSGPDLELFTAKASDSDVHMIPLWGMKFQHLEEYAAQCKGKSYDSICAFEPTGWTFSQKQDGMFKKAEKGRCSLYRIPYSEHSSFQELRMFVEFVRPACIYPTVNVSSAKRVRNMLSHFHDLVSLPPSNADHPLLASLARRDERRRLRGEDAADDDVDTSHSSSKNTPTSAVAKGLKSIMAFFKGSASAPALTAASMVCASSSTGPSAVRMPAAASVPPTRSLRKLPPDDDFVDDDDDVVDDDDDDDDDEQHLLGARKRGFFKDVDDEGFVDVVDVNEAEGIVCAPGSHTSPNETVFDITCVDIDEQQRIMQQILSRDPPTSSLPRSTAVASGPTISHMVACVADSPVHSPGSFPMLSQTKNPRKRSSSDSTMKATSAAKQAKLVQFFKR